MSRTDLAQRLPDMIPRLWAFALRLCGDRQAAEHLVERACLRGLERAHRLQAGTTASIFMYAIVHELWCNELWCNELRVPSVAGRALADAAGDDAAARTGERRITGAFERLPDAQRVVMLLVAAEGLTYREAADVLKIPVGTVMSRLLRARQALGATVGDAAPETRSAWQKD